jgi:pseudaminic acid cytidylyltransferase
LRRLAIIPARGGSKRIPGKNINTFHGKPMISHILETAKLSELFDTIHVSTEDLETMKIVSSLGFKPDFERPDNLAQDATPIMPVLKYVTEQYAKLGTKFDAVWLLMACAPLIEPCDLIEADTLFAARERQSPVLGITEYNVPIEWAFEMDDNSCLSPKYPGMFAKSSSELRPKFHDAGIFAIFPVDVVMHSDGTGSDSDFIGYKLPATKAIDIDTEEDWNMAEVLFQNLKESQSKSIG